MAYKIIRPRHGIKSLWDTYKSRIYKLGEMLVESPESGVGSGPVNIKFGDGVTPYENLPYAVEAPISQLIEGSTKPITSGAVHNAISEQNKNLTNKKTYQIYNFQNTGFMELYYQDGYLCCKINGSSIAKFEVDAWG